MKKEVIKIGNKIEESNGVEKFNTNITNLFVYKVQNGAATATSILKDQKDERSELYGEKSLIVTFKEYVNGKLYYPIYTHFTRGVKTKYNWSNVLPTN